MKTQFKRYLPLSIRVRALSIVIAIIVLVVAVCSSEQLKSVAALGSFAVPAAPPLCTPPTGLLISEFRLRGAAGSTDEFIEFYNNTDLSLTICTADGSNGWALVSSDGMSRFVIPNGTAIPARGHFLAAGSGYSLSAAVAGNLTFPADIPDNFGLALFNTSDPLSFTLANRVDAAGSTSVLNSLYREGNGVPTLTTNNGQYSFARKLNTGTPLDTQDNAADFTFVATDGGNYGVVSILGAPSPENLASPIQRNNLVSVVVIDPSISPNLAPNRVRDTTAIGPNAAAGTLTLRRKVTNNTGYAITRLGFRVVDITTLNTPGYVPGGGQADMRVLSSADETVTLSNGTQILVRGTTVETPPLQANGGGLHSSAKASVVTLSQPLANGASTYVRFVLGVQQTGTFRFLMNIEVDLANSAPTAAPGGPYAAPAGTAIQFNGGGSSDPDGTISNYQWDFGDGTSGSGATPSHVYTTPGVYVARLTVTDNLGATASATVNVNAQDPRINRIELLPGSASIWTGNRVFFSAIAYNSNNVQVGGINFYWRTNYTGQDDQVSITSTGDFQAQIAGNYIVTVEGGGYSAQANVNVVAPNPPCTSNCPPELNIGGEEFGWRPQNYPAAGDPTNNRGNPAGANLEDNGNFQFTIPLLSLAGRGLNFDLALRYNSRLWTRTPTDITFDIDKDWPAPGWSLNLGKMINMAESGAFLIDPDGTRHSFTGTLTREQREYTFVGETTDGSFIKYRVVTPRDPFTGTFSGPLGLVKYPNGMTMHFHGFAANPANSTFIMVPTQITDANGNFIRFRYKNIHQSQQLEAITDSLGRVLVLHYDASSNLTAITAAGPLNDAGNPTSRTLVRINYSSMTLSPSLFSGLTPKVSNSTIPIIKAIFLPGSAEGYWFGDTDSYSAYGMIRKVLMQRNMSFSTVSSDPLLSLREQGTIGAGTMTKQLVYDYPQTPQGLSSGPTFPKVTETWANMDVAPAVTQYVVDNLSNPRRTTITRPDNTKIVRLAYNHSNLAATNPTKLLDGRIFQEELQTDAGVVLRKSVSNWELGYGNGPRITRSEATEIANGQSLTTAVVYDYTNGVYNQVTKLSEYGFGNTLMRVTNTAYIIKNDLDLSIKYPVGGHTAPRFDHTKDISPRFLYLPGSVEVRSSDNTIVGLVEYGYDETQLQNVDGLSNTDHGFSCNQQGCSGLANQEGCFNPYIMNCSQSETYGGQVTSRGNVTSITRYLDPVAKTGPQVEQTVYDIAGNAIKKTLPGGYTRAVTYTKATQNAYPTRVTTGSLTDLTKQVTDETTYDFNTGLVLIAKDANGREARNTYFPTSWRPNETILPTGARINFEYDDVARKITKTTRMALNGTITAQSILHFNGLGLVYREQALARRGVNGAPDVYDNVITRFDQLGRAYQKSRPFEDGGHQSYYTTVFDATGRVTRVTDANGYGPSYFYNESTRPSGASTEPGPTINTIDAWLRGRWVRLDSNGNIAEVVEPEPNGGTGFSTKYFYDTLANLIRIEQGNQVRRFKYDALGRLTHQKSAEAEATLNNQGEKATTEPASERWSDVFTYDDRSNMISRTDARGVKTVFSFKDAAGVDDPLNRLQSVSYDTSRVSPSLNVLPAPAVTYVYRTKNAGEAVNINQVSQARASNISVEDFDYDVEGRIKEKRLTLQGRTKSMRTTYDYDALGRTQQITYPEQYKNDVPNPIRKVVKNNFDIAGRVESVLVNDVNYASQATYMADSSIASLKVGTGSNQVSENYNYEVANGQLVQQLFFRGQQSLAEISYGYTTLFCFACPTTGQITSKMDKGQQHFYTYDRLGRLTKAEGNITVHKPTLSYTSQWQQNYSYDRYGNRTSVTSSGSSGGVPMPTDGSGSLTFDETSNRITTAGYNYDAAGNQLSNGTGQSFAYDAAGRLARVFDSAGAVVASYTYGVSNQRLISQNGPLTSTSKTYYVWDAEQVLTEYVEPSASTVMPQWSKNYIYFSGDLLASEEPNGTGERVSYYHNDRTSVRLVTNNLDTSVIEQVNLPYGTALPVQSAGTSTNKRFTTYDRSSVQGLDYAVNRSYDPRQGRFTSVDPIGMGAADPANPQSLNMYAYVGNDPMNAVDPTGTTGLSFTGFGFGGFGGFPGSGPGGGNTSFWSGLFNFGTGLLGSLISGRPHVLGTPFFSLPPPVRVVPVPTPRVISSAGTFSNVQTQDKEEETKYEYRTWVISRVDKLRQLILDHDKAGTPWDGYRGPRNIRWCASLPQMWDYKDQNLPIAPRRTDSWRMGPALVWGMALPPGAVVANFDRATGQYLNLPEGNHTAIFLSWYQDEDGTRGMWVIEQGPRWLPRGNKIPFNNDNPYYLNAHVFNVVQINQPIPPKPKPKPQRQTPRRRR